LEKYPTERRFEFLSRARSIFALIFCENTTGRIHGIRQGLRKYSKATFHQCHRLSAEKEKGGEKKGGGKKKEGKSFKELLIAEE